MPVVRELRKQLGPFNYNEGAPNYNKDKLVLKPLKTLDNGLKYVGEWNVETDLREGRGYTITSYGDLYEGFYMNGYLNGSGRVITYNGTVYEGEFINGYPHGYGILKCGDGKQY